MTFDELHEKVRKAFSELYTKKLERYGFEVQIELSINSYRQLLTDRDHYFAVKTEVDDPKDCICRGTIYGTKFVITKNTDRVLIAKESADK